LSLNKHINTFLESDQGKQLIYKIFESFIEEILSSPWLQQDNLSERLQKALRKEPYPHSEVVDNSNNIIDLHFPKSESSPQPSNEESLLFVDENNQVTCIPFFNNQLYTTSNSKTEIQGSHLTIIVELAGIVSTEPRLYIFGEKESYKFSEVFKNQSLIFTFTNDIVQGKAYGFLTLEDDHYIVTFSKFEVDDKLIDFGTIDLPITFKCETDLQV